MKTLRNYRPGQVRHAITDASGDTRLFRALPNRALPKGAKQNDLGGGEVYQKPGSACGRKPGNGWRVWRWQGSESTFSQILGDP